MAALTFLSLGANVGDALETLTAAVYALDDLDGFAVEEVSGRLRDRTVAARRTTRATCPRTPT